MKIKKKKKKDKQISYSVTPSCLQLHYYFKLWSVFALWGFQQYFNINLLIVFFITVCIYSVS